MPVEVIGLDRVLRALDSLGERGVDFRRTDRALHVGITDLTRRNFDSRGALVRGWPPLSRRTIEAKARRFGQRPPLVASGRTREILTQPGAPGGVWRVAQFEIVYGSADPVAGYHQRGTRRMPAREVLPPAEEIGRVVTREVGQDAAEFARGLGFEVRR